MPTAEAIERKLQEMLVESIELKAAQYDDDEWRAGLPGAMLEGRINLLEVILDWIQSGGAS